MNNHREVVLWELPVPSTHLDGSPRLVSEWGRKYSLVFSYEGEDGGMYGAKDGDRVVIRLTFSGVEAYKCTFMYLRTDDMITKSYDKLVDLGDTEWLLNSKQLLVSRNRGNPHQMKHLMIYTDDGPCYEFLCSSFSVTPTVTPVEKLEPGDSD